MRKILIKPLVTEKITNLTASEMKYGFAVDYNANKIEIQKAIKDRFDVDVVAINTIRHKGKTRTQFTKKGRFTGSTARYKKAIVTLKEGQTIDLFDEV